MVVNPFDIDRVYSHIGELGRQQLHYMAILSLMYIFTPQLTIQYTFVGRQDVKFKCHLDNKTWLDNACPHGQSSLCQRLEFDTRLFDSIVSNIKKYFTF